MRKMKKKSFDWYGARQRFSIRKYHVGAVSVFLGISLVLGTGAKLAHAEGSVDASETLTSLSVTEETSSSEQLPLENLVVSEAEQEIVIDGQTVSIQDRIATLNYIVQYVLEDGALVTASVRTVAINTTLEIARTTIPVYLEIPEGYELAPGQSESVNQEIVENGQNIVTVKVAKKADTSLAAPAVVEETTVTSEVTSTEIAIPVATTSYRSDETTELVESAVSTPTTVEEAKVVLEQVLSEAELLISEAERLVAMDSANHELKTVAVATKLSVSNAGLVLNNSVAKLDVVNSQINSVRSNVEALVLELRKFSTNGDIVVLLASTTSTTGNLTAGQLNQGPDSDFPVVTTSGQGAYKDGRTSAEEVDIPAGASVSRPVFVETAVYKNDPTEGRYTFLISNLDPYKYAENNARDLYMTVSRDLSDVTAQTVYVRIVDKGTQEVLGTTEVALGANSLPLNGRPENVNFLYVQNGQTQRVPILATVSYQKVEYAGQLLPRLEFYFGSTSYDQFKTTAVWQSNGLTQGLGATVHKLWSYTPQLSTNVTSYLVQGTDELIATYKVTGYEGDSFVSSGKRNFANYEYVSGQPESGTLGIDYKVGDQMITTQVGGNGLTERRVKTIVSEDGDMVITLQYKKNTEEDSEYKTFFETGVLDNLTYGEVAPDTRKYAVEGFGDETAAVPGRTSVYIGRTARWNLYNELQASNAEVIYYYIQKGSVEVFYVDENGNPIQSSKLAVAHGNTDSEYSTVSLRDEKIVDNGITYYYKKIDGIGADGVFGPTTRTDDERTVEEITAERGMVARNTIKELTYVYELAGSVNVNYVDIDGNKLSGTDGAGKVVAEKVADTVNAKAGTDYDTIVDNRPAKIVTADGKTYELAPAADYTVGTVEADHHLSTSNVATVTGIHEATGSVTSGITKEITYVYKEVTGKVVVNFKSIDGEPLQDPRTDTEEGSTGRDYNTEEDGEVPPTITKDGKLYRLVPNVKDGNPTGKVTPGTTEVTYYYEPVLGDVIIKYTDTEGNTLKDTVIDEDDVIVGTDFDTTNEGDKPEVITNSNGKYVLVPSLTTATDPTGTDTTETGKVLEGTTTITYVYQKVANWIPLIPNVPENERPQTEYPFDPTEPDKEIPSIPTNPTTDQPVIPHVPGYTPVDPKDNTPLTPVDPEDPSKGYIPPTPETPGVDTLIPYVPVKGDVVIKYVDTDGNTLKDSVTDEDDVLAGTKYNTTDEGDKPTEIVRNGDKYVLVPSKTTAVDPAGKSVEETGNVVEGTTTITYVYQKVANWIPLIPNVPENERPKTEYPFDPTEPDKEIPSIPTNPTTDQPVIPHVPGYTPVDPKDNTPLTPVDPEDPSKGYIPPTPEIPGVDTLIPYVPIKNGTVIVTYITEDGEEIKSPVTDTPTSPEGTPYDTTDNKPTTITYKGEEYELVRVDGTENGTVVEGDTKVTYVYRKKSTTPPVTPEVKQGTVVVTYITEDGVEIKSPVTDTPISPEGTPYDTTDNKPKTITYNGEEYELVRVDGTENGTVVEGDTKVTYVYRKKPTTPPVTPEVKKGTVVVTYITEDGVEIKSPVTDTPTSPEGTPYDTTDNKPKTITYNGEEYELVRVDGTENGTVVEGDTKVTYVYRKVVKPTPPAPAKPSVAKPVKSEKTKLPDTGEEESTAGMLGVLLLVSSLFGVRKRRRDQQ